MQFRQVLLQFGTDVGIINMAKGVFQAWARMILLKS